MIFIYIIYILYSHTVIRIRSCVIYLSNVGNVTHIRGKDTLQGISLKTVSPRYSHAVGCHLNIHIHPEGGWEDTFLDYGCNLIFWFIYIYTYAPGPSKGCQLNPKGWWIDNHLAPLWRCWLKRSILRFHIAFFSCSSSIQFSHDLKRGAQSPQKSARRGGRCTHRRSNEGRGQDHKGDWASRVRHLASSFRDICAQDLPGSLLPCCHRIVLLQDRSRACPYGLMALINHILEEDGTTGFFTELGINTTTVHYGTTSSLTESVTEYMEKRGTTLALEAETLVELASNSISGAMLSVACSMALLVAAKQQTTSHAVTYVNRRLVAFLQSQNSANLRPTHQPWWQALASLHAQAPGSAKCCWLWCKVSLNLPAVTFQSLQKWPWHWYPSHRLRRWFWQHGLPCRGVQWQKLRDWALSSTGSPLESPPWLKWGSS